MIQPLVSAQRIVPHFTPSKCQRPKARKLIAMPKQKNGTVAQGKIPSAAAPLRLNGSKSTKTLAIDPLFSNSSKIRNSGML